MKIAQKLRLPIAGPGEAGLSILEMLISAAIVSTSGYFTFLAIGKNMAAKKDVEISNYASQFEEPLRYTVPNLIMAKAEASCLDNNSPLTGKELSSEYVFKAFAANPAVFNNAPKQWRDAAARCGSSWRLNTSEQTAHGCYVLQPTAANRKKNAVAKANDPFDPDYVFVEVMFSLFNLAKEKNYATCTPAASGTRAGLKNDPSDVAIAPTEYTGNTNRGYNMLYTVYAYKTGGENRRRYDETSGVKIAGVNFRDNYCITRNSLGAKAPGARNHGTCDFLSAQLTHTTSANPTIEIPKDAVDAFYPPPPDPCEKDPTLAQCKPDDTAATSETKP